MIPLFELKKVQTDFPKEVINSSLKAADFIRNFYGDDIEVFESFFCLFVNHANATIGYAKISQGGVTGTVVDIKIIAKYIAGSLATGIILAHNHPSGRKTPSNNDLELTKRISEMCVYMDCRLLDHVILTATDHYSMAEEGILPRPHL
jgi:DNA repair protein RadC